MKICVCIKQVPDTETKIKVKPDASGIDDSAIKWVVNPYDEFAIEEALKLKASVNDSTVTILSLGPKKRTTDAIRTGLAMGADDGLLIECDQWVDSSAVAKALSTAIKNEGPFDLVFTGMLGIDNNMSCVSQMVAEELDFPHTNVVSKFTHADGKALVEREVEGGTKEVVELVLPAVIGATKGLNMPRYASLPGIMKAKKKPLKELAFADLAEGTTSKLKFSDFQLPPEKPAVNMIEGEPGIQAATLVKALREDSKVI